MVLGVIKDFFCKAALVQEFGDLRTGHFVYCGAGWGEGNGNGGLTGGKFPGVRAALGGGGCNWRQWG